MPARRDAGCGLRSLRSSVPVADALGLSCPRVATRFLCCAVCLGLAPQAGACRRVAARFLFWAVSLGLASQAMAWHRFAVRSAEGPVRDRSSPQPALRPPRPPVQICFLQKVAKHAKERGERAEAGNRWPFRSLGPSLSLLAPSSQLFRISKFGFRIFVPPNRLCDLRVLLFKILFHARAPRTGKGSGVFFEKSPSPAGPTIDRKRLPTPWRVFVLFVSFVVTHPTATP